MEAAAPVPTFRYRVDEIAPVPESYGVHAAKLTKIYDDPMVMGEWIKLTLYERALIEALVPGAIVTFTVAPPEFS